jgi:acetyltransferase
MERARIAAILAGGATLGVLDGRLVGVRSVRPTDAECIQAFVRGLSDAARYMRFFAPIRELTPAMLARLTASDGGNGRVVIAHSCDPGPRRVVAVAQYAVAHSAVNQSAVNQSAVDQSAAAHDGVTCDLALVVADDWQRVGLGSMLLEMLLESARDEGCSCAAGDVLRGNDAMLRLARASGFAVKHSPIDGTMFRVARNLGDQLPARSGSPANSSLQNPPPWNRSPIGSAASFACAASAPSR